LAQVDGHDRAGGAISQPEDHGTGAGALWRLAGNRDLNASLCLRWPAISRKMPMTNGEFIAATEEAIAKHEMSLSRLRFLQGRGGARSEVSRQLILARIAIMEELLDFAYERRNAALRKPSTSGVGRRIPAAIAGVRDAAFDPLGSPLADPRAQPVPVLEPRAPDPRIAASAALRTRESRMRPPCS
jgi:hypothetical protein